MRVLGEGEEAFGLEGSTKEEGGMPRPHPLPLQHEAPLAFALPQPEPRVLVLLVSCVLGGQAGCGW